MNVCILYVQATLISILSLFVKSEIKTTLVEATDRTEIATMDILNSNPKVGYIIKIGKIRLEGLSAHVVAARHLAKQGKSLEEYALWTSSFNAEHSNPLKWVLPAVMMGDGCNYYDRKKYGKLVLEVANMVLKPLEKQLDSFQNREFIEMF